MKGIALTTIHHGILKDGKPMTLIFNEGDKVDLPDADMQVLEASKAVSFEPGALRKGN